MNQEIQVPKEMLETAQKAARESVAQLGFGSPNVAEFMLKTALRWLKENPIVPTEHETLEALAHYRKEHGNTVLAYTWWAGEWQRRMFLVPDPDPRTLVYRQFHKLWTASVGKEGYDKREWAELDTLLQQALYPPATR